MVSSSERATKGTVVQWDGSVGKGNDRTLPSEVHVVERTDRLSTDLHTRARDKMSKCETKNCKGERALWSMKDPIVSCLFL